jgi:hypothetical protein
MVNQNDYNKKSKIYYDDKTLENLKRYYSIDNHEALLRYIRRNGLKEDNQ